jgi:hypothetical protein
VKFLWWRDKPWQQRVLLVLTVVALFLFAAHPELRLLIPVVDLLGLDLFFLLAASHLMDAMRPALGFACRALSPTTGQLYFYFIFCLGIVGPYVDGLLRSRSGA